MAPRSTVVHALLFGVLGAVALSFTWSMVLQWVVKVRLDTARQQRQLLGVGAVLATIAASDELAPSLTRLRDGHGTSLILQYEMTRHAKLFVQPLRWPELFGQTK